MDSWNAHDLDRVLARHSNDFEMSSPCIIQVMGVASGTPTGPSAAGACWSRALAAFPDLQFELIGVLGGVGSVPSNCHGRGRRRASEMLFFHEPGKVFRAAAHDAD
jgi:hypothetical protein